MTRSARHKSSSSSSHRARKNERSDSEEGRDYRDRKRRAEEDRRDGRGSGDRWNCGDDDRAVVVVELLKGKSRDNREDDKKKKKGDDVVKKDNKSNNTELQIQDTLCNPGLEKEIEKHIKRSGGSGDNDKRQIDGRDSDSRRLSSRDDRTKNASYRDERHKDERYRDKFREDFDRDQRHRDDRPRDVVRSSRECNNNRCDGTHYSDGKRPSDSRSKKSKLHDSERDSSTYLEDHKTKFKDTRGRKRSFGENDDHSDLKHRSSKDARRDGEKSSYNRGKLHENEVDTSLSNNRLKTSPSSSTHVGKEQSRTIPKQLETTHSEQPSEERSHSASTGNHGKVTGTCERFSETRSMEKKMTEDGIILGEPLIDTGASSQHNMNLTSDGHVPQVQLAEKSSSSTGGPQFPNRQSAEVEDEGKSSISNDGRECSSAENRVLELPLVTSTLGNNSESDLQYIMPIPVSSSSTNRTGHFSSNSPGHLPPPPPVRHGIDSPSVLGSYEDGNRVKFADRRSNIRYTRNSDLNMERGQGNSWKSGSWPTQAANGFMSFPHGPPSPGFHSAIHQFPAPLFGMRSPMDMDHHGTPYQVHEMSERFRGHGHPFGWRNTVDNSCFAQLQGWDGGNAVYRDESNVHGRPDWHQNRHLMGSHGWEMNAVIWKGQSGSINRESSVPLKTEYLTCAAADDAQSGQSGQWSRIEQPKFEGTQDERTELKRPNNPSKLSVGHSLKIIPERTPKAHKIPNNDNAKFCCNYLAKLDISHDLSCPELYKQCITFLATDGSHDVCNIRKQGDTKSIKEDMKVSAKRLNVNSLDVIFQRAMSVYSKQNKIKVNPPVLPFCSKKEKDPPESSDMENVMADNDQVPEDPSVENINSLSSMEVMNDIVTEAETQKPTSVYAWQHTIEVNPPALRPCSKGEKYSPETSDAEKTKAQAPEDLSAANINSVGSSDEEMMDTEAEGNILGGTDKKESDLIYDLFVEDSLASEPLEVECSVNLSRIHNSLENTH